MISAWRLTTPFRLPGTATAARERVAKAIVSIGSKDIREMIQDNKPIEVKCHFCNHAYKFDIEDLKEILKIAKR